MKLEAFALERLQSIWENRVAWNISESGVHPLRVEELAESDDERHAVLAQALGYPQTNGSPELRESIAAMYPGATAANILVTNGGSEANFVALSRLVEPGDEVVVMTPNYMQVRGVSRGFGARVVPWPLVCDMDALRWRPDLDLLDRLVTPRTTAILICQPNNPTGARLTAGELDRVCAAAARCGAWVLSDEVYRGAELADTVSASLWGRYEKSHRHERAVQGVRAAGAQDRMGRIDRGARRRAVGRTRLHQHRARRRERLPRPHRAHAGTTREAAGENPRHHPHELPAREAMDRTACGSALARAA